MCCEEKLLQQLHERGFRLTPQREMVLRVMHDINENATIDDIFSRVSALCTAVDLSTVYRTLDLLESFNLVSSFKLGDGQRHYELLSLHHAHFHLLCRNCGSLVAIDAHALQPLRSQLVRDHGFQMQLDHLVIPGICRTCQDAESNQSAVISAA
ncbi:MAG: Fur family transcriptional regulator [Anaerolineae bacterium]